MHRSNRDFFHSDQRPNHAMELCHHTLNFIGSMRRHVDARRERLTFATHHHNRDIRTRLDFREHPSQLVTRVARGWLRRAEPGFADHVSENCLRWPLVRTSNAASS